MSEQSAAPEIGLTIEVAGVTDVGRQREQNEDAWGQPSVDQSALTASRGYLVAVADGMGGHALGEVASHLAIAALYEVYYSSDAEPARALATAVERANATIFTQAQARRVSMGTTLVAALLYDSSMTLVNIGDSRAYRLRGGSIRQLTRDHSLVAEQVRRGVLTEADARLSPVRNVLTRSVGARPNVEPDLTETGLAAGDVLLLCSDGLHNLVAPEEMSAAIEGQHLAGAAQTLVELANARGGNDNITCVLVRVVSIAAPTSDATAADAEAADETPAPSRPVDARVVALRQSRARRLLSEPLHSIR